MSIENSIKLWGIAILTEDLDVAGQALTAFPEQLEMPSYTAMRLHIKSAAGQVRKRPNDDQLAQALYTKTFVYMKRHFMELRKIQQLLPAIL